MISPSPLSLSGGSHAVSLDSLLITEPPPSARDGIRKPTQYAMPG